MALQTARLQPPLTAQHTDDATGRPSPAWIDHYQQMADQLADLRASQGKGVTDGSNAAAGMIGEYLTATAASVSLSSGVAADVATLALTAGDWDVVGYVALTPGTGTTSTHHIIGTSNTAAAFGGYRQELFATFPAGSAAASFVYVAGMPQRFSLAAPATAHLVASATFTGTMVAGGRISARRMR